MIKTMHDFVAIKPLVFEHDRGQSQQTIKGFVGTDKLTKTVISSQVVFSSKNFKPGQTVYLRADAYNAPQAKQVMKIEDSEFILIPETLILATNEEIL